MKKEREYCAICGCELHRGGEYATPTIDGRSHATEHHYIAERFFGRSKNRQGTRPSIFEQCPWDSDNKTDKFCYDCHEELLHNPVFLPNDIEGFKKLVERQNLKEPVKTENRNKLAGRIKLLHEVLELGIKEALKRE